MYEETGKFCWFERMKCMFYDGLSADWIIAWFMVTNVWFLVCDFMGGGMRCMIYGKMEMELMKSFLPTQFGPVKLLRWGIIKSLKPLNYKDIKVNWLR